MDEKIAVITVMVSDFEKTEKVNTLLSSYREYVVGRFGLPLKEKNVAVICVVLNATSEVVNSLSGKLGMINGVTSKVITTK